MKIKKILIIKPKVKNNIDKNGNAITHYTYPKGYKAECAKHICYNFLDGKNLKGGHLSEGMVIYEAEEEEIKALLQEDGIEEISYDNAKIKGKKWRPKKIINGIEKKAFNIKDWIKDKTKINDKKLT